MPDKQHINKDRSKNSKKQQMSASGFCMSWKAQHDSKNAFIQHRKGIQKNMIKVCIMSIFYEQVNISIAFYGSTCNLTGTNLYILSLQLCFHYAFLTGTNLNFKN